MPQPCCLSWPFRKRRVRPSHLIGKPLRGAAVSTQPIIFSQGSKTEGQAYPDSSFLPLTPPRQFRLRNPPPKRLSDTSQAWPCL